MADTSCARLQDMVSTALIRHRSILDVISKLQDTSARLNRTAAKAATECGCVEFHVVKQAIPEDTSFSDLAGYMSSHISGELCEDCREALEKEIGRTLFYLVSLCDITGLDFSAIVEKECRQLSALGAFTLA